MKGLLTIMAKVNSKGAEKQPKFNAQFLTMLEEAETKALTKASKGVRQAKEKDIDAYVNRQQRLFGISKKHGAKFDIECGAFNDEDGKEVKFFKIKENKDGKFVTSAASTGTPFITVTKLMNEFFGETETEWKKLYATFTKVDKPINGYTYYILKEVIRKEADEKADNKAEKTSTKKSTK